MKLNIPNLATLIGTKNLMNLISDEKNTHFVTLQNDVLEIKPNSPDTNYALVIGCGKYTKCQSLIDYLQSTEGK